MQNMNLGVSVQSLITLEILHWLAIAFVNDTDFYSSGDFFREMMQEKINLRAKLHEAIGENTIAKDNALLLEVGSWKRD